MLILAKNAEIMLLLFTLSQVKTPQQVRNKQVDAKNIFTLFTSRKFTSALSDKSQTINATRGRHL